MKKRGGITVFLSLCLLCVFALLCVMAESVRTAGSRFYYQTAVNGALDHLFSRYHRELWRQYRILGLPYESEEELSGRLTTYVEKYLDTDNWYPIKQNSMEITRCEGLADQGGDFLTREILDYMRYGIWESLLLRPEDGKQLWDDIREGTGAGTLTDVYDGQAKEVGKLEKAVRKILACVRQQEEYASDISAALDADDPEGFRGSARAFRKEAGRMDGLIREYDRQAEKLKGKMTETKDAMAGLKEDFREDHAGLFEEQMDPYAAYVDQDGARRKELLEQKAAGDRNLELLNETEELVDTLEEEYENRVSNSDEEDGEEEELSLAAAAGLWSGYQRSGLNLRETEGDPQKRKALDQVKEMVQGGLLRLVLPDDMQVSGGAVTVSLPSQKVGKGDSQLAPGPAERVLIHEYCGNYFTNALSRENHPLQYEMEYLLHGKNTDRENLQETVSQIFLVRLGMNLLHILTDSGKREEAKGLAVVIVGLTGLEPLVEITAYFIMGVWAAGEAVMDLRQLLDGGRIPLWKKGEDWCLSLEGLLTMGQNKHCPEDGERESGFEYEHYLKLLLFLKDHQELQMRMLDMMEWNIRREEAGFSIENCAYRVDISGKAGGKHVFFALKFVDNFIGDIAEYPLEAPAGRAY